MSHLPPPHPSPSPPQNSSCAFCKMLPRGCSGFRVMQTAMHWRCACSSCRQGALATCAGVDTEGLPTPWEHPAGVPSLCLQSSPLAYPAGLVCIPCTEVLCWGDATPRAPPALAQCSPVLPALQIFQQEGLSFHRLLILIHSACLYLFTWFWLAYLMETYRCKCPNVYF